jgi:hypothetical protein
MDVAVKLMDETGPLFTVTGWLVGENVKPVFVGVTV